MNRIGPCLAVLLCAGVASGAALAQTTTQVIRGDVAAVEPSALRVKSPTGQESIVRVPDDVRVSVRAPATLDAIRSAEPIDVAATTMPGPNVFHRPMRVVGATSVSGASV